MIDNSDELDLQIVNLEKIWDIKLDARFDALMIMMSENQWNSSSSSQIRISSDESTTFSQTFKSEKIRFFDLKLNTSLDKKDTISLGKKIWIWNVFVFISWIKDIITIKKDKIVHVNLFTCLRDAVQWWYSDELSEWDKIMLRVDINQ